MHRTGWIVTAAVTVALAAVIAATVYAGDNAAPAAAATTQMVKSQVMCPVMGGAVDKQLFVDHAGKRIYVCCRGCIGTVQKDPAKYIAKLEAEGITLDKAPQAAATNAPAAKAD